MSFQIRGIGTALPAGHVTPDEGLQVARVIGGPVSRESGFLPAVYEGSGNRRRALVHGRDVIRDLFEGTRHSGSPFLPNGDPNFRGPSTGVRNAMYCEHALPMAVSAARDALTAAGLSAVDVTHIVTVSCTGFTAPGLDFALIQGLNLRPTVLRTHVGFMGCHGALNGLRVADAYTRADPAAVVLLVAVELCSLHYHFGDDPEKVVANALFADGAAAVVGTAGNGPWHVTATGSCLIPNSADAMTWTIGDHGFEMTLSKQVPKRIAEHLGAWMREWLSNHRLSVADIPSWAVHPGGPKIIDAVEMALGLQQGATTASRRVFTEFGNMSSPTVLFIVQDLMQSQADSPCVMLGFGPGLVAEAILIA
ncbi:type III polyketide synthase [Limnoglobus roseus]|uniref:Type III polyketide synthase n=1 Tax=Limnoglobus roseus TaxID=2598579 RepID=A0A5C1A2E2_9BACT|nr:type III polyketide synthase [Limnoglobus roseus]QEL13279.1 type III polyketide synthase [Limnoglobus roseus]